MHIHELIRLLREDGWRLARWRGHHRQYQHPVKGGTCTVSQGGMARLPPGCLRSLRKRVGLGSDTPP